ncbi:MAG: indolepyruvate oxidoreductase subunit beta [Coriobacteriales bacterium]|jgi:indolepyruvate ferredoxin oxidoreductase beta subunit|nr:indolepyruvate oxidoreductase subunit beta [Coriobacteriales bacterium]
MSDFVVAGVGGQGTVLASKLLAQAALLEGRTVRTAETIGMAQRGGSVLGHVRIGSPPHQGEGVTGGTVQRDSGDGTVLSQPAHARAVTKQYRPRCHAHCHAHPLSPLVPLGHADLLLGFEPGETVRALAYLREGGTVVTARQTQKPVTATLGTVAYDGTAELDYLHACEACGRIGRLLAVDGARAVAAVGLPRALNVVLLGAALSTGAIDLPRSAFETALERLVKPRFVEPNKQALALFAP